jgi:hypothetical protein
LIVLIYDALYLMNWTIDWTALPIICEMLGMADIETAVRLMRMVITEEKQRAS